MVIKFLLLFVVLGLVSCKPFKRDIVLERSTTLKGINPVVVHSQRRRTDDWCFIYFKYEISKDDFLRFARKFNLSNESGYPIIDRLKEADSHTMALWNPGPGLGYDQISSKLLYTRLLERPHDLPESFIAFLYKDGNMYIKAAGLKDKLTEEFNK